jgi:hypothetical protein
MAEEQRFKRLYPRRQYHTPCRVSCVDRLITGKVVDVSYNGVSILLPAAIELADAASIEIPKRIRVRVRPVYNQPVFTREERTHYRVGFKVQLVEQGMKEWTDLCHVVHW